MMALNTVEVAGITVTVYALAGILIGIFCIGYAELALRRCFPEGTGVLTGLAAALSGLFFGRVFYCVIQADRLFFDPMGNFAGIGPFFYPDRGSVSVIGVLIGGFLGCLLIARIKKLSIGALLDKAVKPGLLAFALFRFIEPLSGQGYGPTIRSKVFSRVPFAIPGWDEWSLSVCFVEGILLFVVLLTVFRVRLKKDGSLFVLAAVLTALTQILPESLRQDDALRVFVFARVNQLGYTVIWALCGIYLWRKGYNTGNSRNTIAAEASLAFVGILLLIAAEFALDKMNWPKILIYAGMALTLIGIGIILIRALKRADAGGRR